MYVQVPQVVPSLIFSYSGRGFTPPVPILQSINWRGARRETASEDLGKNVAEYVSLFFIC